jgi:EAL domain-containing protein (putative c-di-GMP-specific phosphodiesterase class I)
MGSLSNWLANHIRVGRVAVNLSSKQFQKNVLIDTLKTVLNDTQLNPQYLELELTESTVMQKLELATIVMDEMKSIGLQLSIDDFGTGYSSLSYLRRFPIDSLKIDRSFVIDLENSEQDACIVKAIIAMAHSLKLKVIAEGVENEQQREFLQAHNCDQMQGYLFSPPISPCKISALYAKQITDIKNNVDQNEAIQTSICTIQD